MSNYILPSVIDSAISGGVLVLGARIFNMSTKGVRSFLYQAISALVSDWIITYYLASKMSSSVSQESMALIVNPAITGLIFMLIIKMMHGGSYESWLYLWLLSAGSEAVTNYISPMINSFF